MRIKGQQVFSFLPPLPLRLGIGLFWPYLVPHEHLPLNSQTFYSSFHFFFFNKSPATIAARHQRFEFTPCLCKHRPLFSRVHFRLYPLPQSSPAIGPDN